MGFMDKAKKMAEQAQTKLDDAQKQFNENQAAPQRPSQEPVPQYDAHGRPVQPATPAPPAPSAPPAPPIQPHGDPLGAGTTPPPPPAPPAPEGAAERKDEYAPPKLSSGDPLAGP